MAWHRLGTKPFFEQMMAENLASMSHSGTDLIGAIRRTLAGNWIVDHLDVVGASPVGDAPTTSSFST